MEDLGLNEYHINIIKSYMQFAKYQRSQNIQFIDISFQDVIDARLTDTTFTRDEVKELLQNLKDLVEGEVEADLIDISHTNVLLFSQLLKQAEKWHLRMSVDLSEIQNRELLDKVKLIEENENKIQVEKKKLQPLVESNGTLELLRIEIDRIKKENEKLESNLQSAELKIMELQNEKEQLTSENKAEEKSIEKPDEHTTENVNIENNKQDSETLLKEYEKILRDQLSLELESMKQEMVAVQSQLSLAEQELERKFNQTAAYTNMKMMINKKNEQVKELRTQLLKYQQEGDSQE
ncbi:leucine zipper transcription factor-like protein 1 [Halyomorpha halys]|uniref:leucine zipper transcription factor-like protein 1 n=1 Tax=Halyomorpha halys TaxID=286706 RepID=UPI0006D52011|nr:leucine zipper transcription factor-like protein 1 [Halyomorpha halys]